MKGRNAKLKKMAVAVAGLFIFFPIAALAYNLLEPLPGGEGGVITQFSNLTDYLNWVFRFTLAAAAFLAVIKIVIGGMMIMTGGASESSVTKGKEMISMAIWGLILAISSVLILTTINPNLIKNSLDIPPTGKIESPAAGGPTVDLGEGGCCVNVGISVNECGYVQSSDDCKKGTFEYLQSCENFDGCKGFTTVNKCPDGFVWSTSLAEPKGSCVDLSGGEKVKEMITCYGKDKFKDKTKECEKKFYTCGYYYTGTPKCEDRTDL